MKCKFVIYLSSTTYRWWNLKSFHWKQKLITSVKRQLYGLKHSTEQVDVEKLIEWIDPLSFKSEDPIVCPKDIKDINRSNLVVCYIDKLSIGTLLELGYCLFNNNKKDVIVVCGNKYVWNHPWIISLCKTFSVCSIEDCATLVHDKIVNWYFKHE